MSKELILIICLSLGFVILGIVYSVVGKNLRKIKTKISFRNSISKTNLIILPMYNCGKKLNFIVDSGSTCNVIDKRFVPQLSHMVENFDISGIENYSISGTTSTSSVISMPLVCGNETFFDTFFVMDLEKSFAWSGEEFGEDIHGILGMDFLTHYGKVINFNDYTIHSK